MFERFKNLIGIEAVKTNIINPSNYNRSSEYQDISPAFNLGAIEDEIIIEEGYKGNADNFAILNAIKEESSSVKYLIKDSKGEEVTDGEAFDLLNSDEDLHFSEKVGQFIINYGMTGDSFLYFVPSEGFSYSRRFEVLRSVDVSINLNVYNEVVSYTYNEAGRRIEMSVDDVLHIKDYDPSSEGAYKRGLSRFKAGYNVLNAGNNREIASSNVWKNNGVSALLSDKAGTLQDEDDAKRLQRSLNNKTAGPENAGRLIVTSAELEKIDMSFSPKELSIDKTANDHLRKLASMFNVSSRQFNDPQGSTYNNLATDSENFFIKGCLPMHRKLSLSLETELRKRGYDVSIELDTSEVYALESKRLKSEENEIKKGEAVEKVLLSNLSDKQKISILVSYHKYSDQDAQQIVKDGQGQNQENQTGEG